MTCSLKVGVVLVRERRVRSLLEFLLVSRNHGLVELDLWRGQGGRSNKLEGLVTDISRAR
jgi:hypothetical protein